MSASGGKNGWLVAMLPLFAAVFIDLFSFGLMYPVIILLFERAAILRIYGTRPVDIYLSLVFSLFPLGMFFGASLLGDLSDAFGRRRTLVLCMVGLGSAYALMLLGIQTGALGWFLVGRLLSGLMAGTSPIAQAAMMDHARPEERGDRMSHVVLVNCLALVSGPAAGGLLAHLDLRAPLIFAIALCAIALVWIARSRYLFQFGFTFYYTYIQVRMGDGYRLSPAGLGLFSATIGIGFDAARKAA